MLLPNLEKKCRLMMMAFIRRQYEGKDSTSLGHPYSLVDQ